MFKRFLRNLQNNQQRRADYWLLNNMTDNELKDIGITRGEIKTKIQG